MSQNCLMKCQSSKHFNQARTQNVISRSSKSCKLRSRRSVNQTCWLKTSYKYNMTLRYGKFGGQNKYSEVFTFIKQSMHCDIDSLIKFVFWEASELIIFTRIQTQYWSAYFPAGLSTWKITFYTRISYYHRENSRLSNNWYCNFLSVQSIDL